MPASIDLERLYDEHAQALFAFLLNFTRNEADTRDLLQELFVKLAQKPGLMESVRDETAFLQRLVHNAAIDLMRRRGAQQRNYEELATAWTPSFAGGSNPDEHVLAQALSEGLAELPAEQRAV